MKGKTAQLAAIMFVVLFLGLLPLALGGQPYYLEVMASAFFYAVLTSSWSFLAGLAGQFSFGHMAFAGLGAYTSGLLCRYLGVSPLYGILTAIVVTALFGFGVGILCLRLRGAYLALFTIALSEILRIIVLTEHQFTEGNRGLLLPPLYPGITPVDQYYITLVLLLATLGLLWWLARSRFGIFLRAIREDEEAAAALGVNTVRYKVSVFVLTSVIAGLAGAIFYHLVGIVTPEIMQLLQMSLIIAFAVIGGLESPITAAFGAVLCRILLEFLRGFTILGVHIEFGVWRYAVFGLLLVLTLRFAQNGLFYPIIDHLFIRPARREAVARRKQEVKDVRG